MTGSLALVLHAHLPYVRHPEHDRFYEESWLHEAVAECYLPLLAAMEGWDRDRVPWRLTLTLTPTLCAMLEDALIRSRTERHLAEWAELAARETERTLLQPDRHAVAQFYQRRGSILLDRWRNLRGDLLAAFRRHQEAGNLEILTCAATHALLPLWLDEPAAIRAQLAVASGEYRRIFGRRPDSLWLPECAWDPGLEPHLADAGLSRFVVETHGLMLARPRPRCATFAPVRTPLGLTAFARDPASARQVWSRHGGYPGDPRYREFHQDLAHEAEWEYLRPILPGVETRVFTGFKYHRVDEGAGPKGIYVRSAALAAAREHARHFVEERRHLLSLAAADMPGIEPLLVAPFDAELFGHWWFEGPEFLDAVVRTAAAGSGLSLTHLREHVARRPAPELAVPARSSWGEGGHLGVWIDGCNAWMLPALRTATSEMAGLAARHAGRAPDSGTERCLRQMGRELLLAQASDWPFLVRMGTAGDYPVRRLRGHLENFGRLRAVLEAPGDSAARIVAELEARSPLFPDLDWRHWA